MPIDPTIFKDVSPGEFVDASEFRKRFEELQRFVNGGIDPEEDFEEREFITSEHIEKPEFYGSPNPRIEAVSSNTTYRSRRGNMLDRYYRHESSGSVNLPGSYSHEEAKKKTTAWQPIEGMSASVFNERTNATAHVIGSFYVMDQEGADGFQNVRRMNFDDFGYNERDNSVWFHDRQYAAHTRVLLTGRIVGETMLFLNGEPVEQTRRRIYSRGQQAYNFRRQQHSFARLIDLNLGENKISYRFCYRLKGEDDVNVRHVVFDERNFIVDCHHK